MGLLLKKDFPGSWFPRVYFIMFIAPRHSNATTVTKEMMAIFLLTEDLDIIHVILVLLYVQDSWSPGVSYFLIPKSYYVTLIV